MRPGCHGDWTPADGPPVSVPTAYLELLHVLLRPPRSLVEPIFNIQSWTKHDRGGHFAAWEQPDAVVADAFGAPSAPSIALG